MSSTDSKVQDLNEGLRASPPFIPSKYFYDDLGSALFDAICDLPEYYLTRSEQALLDEVAGEVAGITQARELVELGSGTARKTRTLIGAHGDSCAFSLQPPTHRPQYRDGPALDRTRDPRVGGSARSRAASPTPQGLCCRSPCPPSWPASRRARSSMSAPLPWPPSLESGVSASPFSAVSISTTRARSFKALCA